VIKRGSAVISAIAIACFAAITFGGVGAAQAEAPGCVQVQSVIAEAEEIVRQAESVADEAERVERAAERELRLPGTVYQPGPPTSYRGGFVNGARSGYGQISFTAGPSVGEYYVGEFRNGDPNGLGSYHGREREGVNAGWVFRGQYQDGLKHGLGVFTSEDGTVAAGEHRAGEMLGLGELRLPDSFHYIGEIVSGGANGIGMLRDKGGLLRGRFRDGILLETCTE